ncbi:MAG: HD domain-containing protein [Ruminococcus sp.]|jgi:tRNA nucleotidyltransferase (CCA-adding enzyme)|nr:HD domain-containing protein [Ruminococcus sp.]
MENKIPEFVLTALKMLTNNNFEAYIVGGCVRDMLLGTLPVDYDITTNATPEQIKEVFSEYKTIDVGIRYGTVCVIIDGESIEITTYRIDGEYKENRHPENVKFTANLEDDLSRRDFTVNAVAVGINGEVTDPFNGKNDVKNKIIRCVGDPEKRFGEDALRIMRAVRFASVLVFEIEENTKKAIFKLKDNLNTISAERIGSELKKLLVGDNVKAVLLEYAEVLSVWIPEILPCIGFDQKSVYHKYTVWEHIARATEKADKNIRLAVMLHDIGKPPCYSYDGSAGHFPNHAKVGSEMAKKILTRLKFDNKTISEVSTLIREHSAPIFTKIDVKKMLSKIGVDIFFKLIDLKIADNSAKTLDRLSETDRFLQIKSVASEVIAAGEPLFIKDLAVGGLDIAALGYKGREISQKLCEILNLVIEEKISNDKEEILTFCRQ